MVVVSEIENATVEQLMLKQADVRGEIKNLREEHQQRETRAGALRSRIAALFGTSDRISNTIRQKLLAEGFHPQEIQRVRNLLGIESEGDDWVLRPE